MNICSRVTFDCELYTTLKTKRSTQDEYHSHRKRKYINKENRLLRDAVQHLHRINRRLNHVLDLADGPNPTLQHELDPAYQEYVCGELSTFST